MKNPNKKILTVVLQSIPLEVNPLCELRCLRILSGID